jgi:hypothetical protein
MNDLTRVEFAGTDEELEGRLLAFARATRGGAARDRGGWRYSSGSLLATNPNCLRVRIDLRREEGGLVLASRAAELPWTRAKASRIAEVRRNQLADVLAARGGPPAASGRRLREPFAAGRLDPAGIAAAVAWSAAAALAALAAAAVAASIASLPLLRIAVADIHERARSLEAAGALVLPNATHPTCVSCGAVVFAAPIAFLAGFVHWASLQVGEWWTRAGRLPQASFLFLTILLAAAFFPFTPLLALPLGASIPLAVHGAYTVVWGRRREERRVDRAPRRGLVLAAWVMGAAALAALLPRPVEREEFTDRLALVRDRFLLGNWAGRRAARTYYAHTLTSADPLLRQFFTLDDDLRPARFLRTARVGDAATEKLFRSLHFAVVPPGVPADVRQEGGTLVAGSESVPWGGDAATLPRALDDLARASFRGSRLREVYWLAWHAVYFGGPLVALLLPSGLLAALLVVLLRKLRSRTALVATGVIFLGSTVSLATVLLAGNSEGWADLDALRRGTGPEAVARGLASPSPAVRHEAAFLAARHPEAALTPALLRAAGDPDLRVRIWAVAALGATGSPEALPELLERLNDPELFVRYRAAEGLGRLGRREAVEPLLRMVRERSWYEGLYAAQALRALDPARF